MHTLIICRQHQITKMTYSAGGTGVLKNLQCRQDWGALPRPLNRVKNQEWIIDNLYEPQQIV